MSLVLLVGKDWSTRALLRAQLLEEGVQVEALEDTTEAVMAVEHAMGVKRPGAIPSPVAPAALAARDTAGGSTLLIVADLSSSENPEGDAQKLASVARAVPTWIIAGTTLAEPKNLGDRGFERILYKPLDLGYLVAQIKQRLGQDRL